MKKSEIKSLIKRRRAQVIIHSCIYYEMNDNVVPDDLWQEWADELEQLQTKHPDCCKLDFFDFEFKDWTGATGAHLPYRDPWVYAKALYVLELCDKYGRI